MLFSKVVMIDVRSWCMGGVFVCLLPGAGLLCVVWWWVGQNCISILFLMRTVETPSSSLIE